MGKWEFTPHLTIDLQSKKTTQLLARMLYGECTSKSMDNESENQNEMLAFWQVVKNSCNNLKKKTIKDELLTKNRYESLTADSEDDATGLNPEYNINWARAVIIATLYQKGKANSIKKAPKISKNMQYFYDEDSFYGSKTKKAAYNSNKSTITWTDGSTDKVIAKQQYATTVFFAIKSGYAKKG